MYEDTVRFALIGRHNAPRQMAQCSANLRRIFFFTSTKELKSLNHIFVLAHLKKNPYCIMAKYKGEPMVGGRSFIKLSSIVFSPLRPFCIYRPCTATASMYTLPIRFWEKRENKFYNAALRRLGISLRLKDSVSFFFFFLHASLDPSFCCCTRQSLSLRFSILFQRRKNYFFGS